MERLERVLCGFASNDTEVVLLVEEEVPEAAQEAEATVDTVAVPRFALVDGTEEHFIETKRVGTVAFYNLIGIYNVEHGLRHLLNRPSANVLAVFENEFRSGKFGAPSLEGFNVEYVILNDIYIYVQGSYIVLILETEAHESIGVLNTVHKV